MPTQNVTINILRQFQAGTLPTVVVGLQELGYSTIRRYYRLFKLLLDGDSLTAMCHRTSWSESTVRRVVRWSIEAEPDLFKHAREVPGVVVDTGQPAEVAPEIVRRKQSGHPEILSKLARLFDETVVIPPVTRISGIETNEWSRGYYGALDQEPGLAIEFDPLFKQVVAEYEVQGFESAITHLKSALLKYSVAARRFAEAITEQIQAKENYRSGDPELVDVSGGLLLAVTHYCLERSSGLAGEPPPINVTGDAATGFVLELGGWRVEYGDKSTAESVAANFGTMTDRASGLAESCEVRKSYSKCVEALAEVIRTLGPKHRVKI